MSSVEMKKLVEKMKLKNLTPDISLAGRKIEVPDINRPALQLTGFLSILMRTTGTDHWLCGICIFAEHIK